MLTQLERKCKTYEVARAEIMNGNATHSVLKDAIRAFEVKDASDAIGNAALLYDLMRLRFNDLLAANNG